jgi:predicted dehydrogenase
VILLNLAIIGTGEWGQNHIRVSKELGVLKKICDIDESRLKYFKSYYGVDYTTSFKDILDDKSIDAVTLAVPASLHYKMGKQLLEAGKHILIEKPISTEIDEAEKLIALAEKQGLTISVGHVFRYNNALNYIKDMINNGNLGDVQLIISRRMGLRTPRPDCGVIMDFAIHDVDIAKFLMNEKIPQVMSAVKSHPLGREYEDYGNIVLKFGDALADISVSWLTPTKVRDLMIVASEKSVILDYSTQEIKVYDQGIVPRYSSFGEFALITKEGDIYVPKVKFQEPLKLEIEDFLKSAESGKEPIANAKIGLEALKIINSTYRIAKNGEKK